MASIDLFLELQGLIGDEFAIKVFRYFEGRFVYFGKLDLLLRKERNSEILKDFTQNKMKISGLMHKYDLSHSYLHALLRQSGKVSYRKRNR